MIIRKEFKVESAHIVRNCTSERCSHSIHGHSAVIEVFLESEQLDNAQMVYDFGLMKTTIKQFIDSMDHCYLLCVRDKTEFKNFIKQECDRWIELPFNPSAEMLSLFIFNHISQILAHTTFQNGEQRVTLKAVRYHETSTGYAECNLQDLRNLWKDDWVICYSDGVKRDWSQDLRDVLAGKYISNPVISQQIEL